MLSLNCADCGSEKLRDVMFWRERAKPCFFFKLFILL